MPSTFRLIVIVGVINLSSFAHAAATSQCPQLYPRVQPQIPADLYRQVREICFDAYAVLHSGQTKTPILTIERLTREQLQAAEDEDRTNRFYPEARLPAADRAQLDDYKDSGFDRGHMAPAGDMPNAQAMAQSFSLANMIPQAPKINRGAWAGIEKATRKYVMRASGAVYVFTGPVFQQRPAQTIGNGVWVPTQTFKLVYDQAEGRAWAYWIDNIDSAKMSRPISYSTLVDRTGMDLLPGLLVRE